MPEPTSERLHILFIQTQLCSRTWKFARALHDEPSVTLSLLELSGNSPLRDYSVFDHHITLDHGKDLRSLLRARRRIQHDIRKVLRERHYDIVHTHNAPDAVGLWAKRAATVPVVHDIHDLQTTIPVRWGSWLTRPVVRTLYRRWERQVCRRADSIVVPSPAFLPFLRDRYHMKDCVAIENKPAPVAVRPKARLSSQDGQIHVVYAGGLSTASGSHRDYFPTFDALAGGDIHLHVYGVTFTELEQERLRRFCDRRSNVHYHAPVPATALIDELTQYDYGFLWFPVITDNIRMSSPNKLWEYLLAGLPAIVNPDTRPAAFVAEHGCGFAVADMAQARKVLQERRSFTIPREGLTQDAGPLLSLYRRLITHS